MTYYIFGKIEDRVIKFVGCTKNVDILPDSIILQEVEKHPLFHWVKWSVRHRRTLNDKTALNHRLANYFTNPLRLKYVLGDEDFERRRAKENAVFLRFNQKHTEILDKFFDAAFAKKVAGHKVYSAGELIGQLRWGNGRQKGRSISDKFVAWYSRLAQMLEAELVGFFKLRASMADGLEWTDGRTWEQFASENRERLKWSEPYDDLEDSDWEYTE